ncbi:LacI family DNA-binding transcriptional regulator, partial [Actinosynnema sp. NPDC059797]
MLVVAAAVAARVLVRGRREPSMADVAALAGVSHQTVSRVVNDLPNVRDLTKRRVLAAIEALGYRPDWTARALASGRPGFLGVVARNSTLYGPASLLSAFESAAAAAGFAVGVRRVREPDRVSVAAAVEHHRDQR